MFNLLNYLSLLKKTRVRQVVLDKWPPLILTMTVGLLILAERQHGVSLGGCTIHIYIYIYIYIYSDYHYYYHYYYTYVYIYIYIYT